MHCLEHAAVCIVVAVLSGCYQIQLSFTLVKKKTGVRSGSRESPGVEATNQESDSESIKLPRPVLAIRFPFLVPESKAKKGE